MEQYKKVGNLKVRTDLSPEKQALVNQIAKNYINQNKKIDAEGIKGISYNGGIDGKAAVIFNPDDIVIGRKYYNQPTLKDIYNKFINSGAIAGAITNP